MTPDLREAAAVLRQLALEFDAAAERIQEAEFRRWQAETVYPAAVVRHIEEIGHV